jgi:putative CocE/NonD family hydrolase
MVLRVAAVCCALLCGFFQAFAGQPPIDLSAYTGEYRWVSEPEIVTAIRVQGGQLWEEREGRPRQPLSLDAGGANTADRFALKGAEAHLTFTRDSSGRVTGLRITPDRDPRNILEEKRTGDTPPTLAEYREYVRQDVMIPMRDGVKLHAAILRPKVGEPGTAGSQSAGTANETPLPFLMQRTPYGVEDYNSARINNDKPELAASGYIFVFEDIRGRYGSEGTFVMNRPVLAHTNPNNVDESTDTRDSIDWLLKNVPGNSGRVGVYGVSYPGFLAMMAGIDPHPALKAISPQAPMTDVWMGDDFFHNGAFRQTYGFDYVQQMEGQKTDVVVDSKEDAYEFFLKKGNFANAAAAAKIAGLPTAKKFLEQPTYTKFWREMAVESRLNSVNVPTLEVGGYWDQEDMWGTQAEYAALKQHDSQHQVFMVLGPWNHGEWDSTARTLGSLNFGHATGMEYRKQFEAPFFDHYLKDAPGSDGSAFDLKDVASFRSGSNEWERYSAWPPMGDFAPAKAYLAPGQTLGFSAPAATEEGIAATYVSDPANPVPYRHRPIQSTYAPGSKWYTWMVEDQRFVSRRKDLANFETPVLDHDMTVTGEVLADLFVSTTGSDADLVVKMIDVYPDDEPASPGGTKMSGFQLMVSGEIFRGRYLHSFEKPEPLQPGQVNEFRWSLHGIDHTFLKGHRMMVEVQSTWFPLYDRNPQTFVPNIMDAPAKAYRPETVTIYGSPQYPSHLEFELLK